MDQLSEVIGPQVHGQLQGVHQKLIQASAKYPDSLAFASIHQPDIYLGVESVPLEDDLYRQQPHLRWTFRQYQETTQKVVAGLKSLGVKKGTPIFTFISNSIEYYLLFWAAAQLGCYFVPINPNNLLNVEEATHMVNIAKSVASAYPGVIFAQNQRIVSQVQTIGLDKDCQIVVCSSEEEEESSHLRFAELLKHGSVPAETELSEQDLVGTTFILFTSGTTSLPKGVVWNDTQWAYALQWREGLSPMKPGDSCCLVVPNNHALHIVCGLSALTQGAAVVFPGPAFQPHLMLTTMQREKCTHSVLVPAMVHALTVEQSTRGGKIPSLKSLALGGAVATPDALIHAQDVLGFEEVENAFGSTEGGFLSNGSHKDRNAIVKGDSVAAGINALPAGKVRICAPDEYKPVPRGVLGELHTGGPTVVTGYIGKKTTDFYKDENGMQWYKTGDQAVMDPDGRIFITGRYKENIIRGGENVSPAAIEAVIGRHPKFAKFQVQIVRAFDSIAGEVPVAVCGVAIENDTAQDIQNIVLSEMGAAFVPAEVLSLTGLGLKDFPKTMAGKIQKVKLAEIVEEYRKKTQTNGISPHSDENIADEVGEIWKRTVGHDVDRNASIADFSDSITLMRVRDRIQKQLGYNISLADMIAADTLAGQVELIKNLPKHHNGGKLERKRATLRKKPLSANDIVMYKYQPESEQFTKAKRFIGESLASFGLELDRDVQDVVPAQDFVRVHTQNGTMDSWTWTFGILSKIATVEQMRNAVTELFANHPILPSFFLWDKEAFDKDELAVHVIPKLSPELLKLCIVNHGKVKTVEDLRKMCQENMDLKYAKLPGPLTYAAIVEVEETKSTAVIILMHHCIIDASGGQLIFEDLDRILGGQALIPHIDYKIWADSYYSLRSSLDAQASVEWHVKQLANIASHEKAVWPLPKPQVNGAKPIINKEGEDGISHSFIVPGLTNLRRKHNTLSAPAILKTAWALFNVQRTGHTHALFSNIEAARTRFPFIPEVLDDLTATSNGTNGGTSSSSTFEATDVAGPLFQLVTNLLEIQPEETALALLHRIQSHQTQLTRHASAPLTEILRQVDEISNQRSEGTKKADSKPASDILVNTVRTQIFNYLSTMANSDDHSEGSTSLNPYKNMEIANGVVRPELGIAVNCGVGTSGGGQQDKFFLHFRSVVLSDEEMQGIAKQVEAIVRWITTEENWERKIKELDAGAATTNGVGNVRA